MLQLQAAAARGEVSQQLGGVAWSHADSSAGGQDAARPISCDSAIPSADAFAERDQVAVRVDDNEVAYPPRPIGWLSGDVETARVHRRVAHRVQDAKSEGALVERR